MSLHVYTDRSEIPEGIKYIDDNEAFFNGSTRLKNCAFVQDVLEYVDKAEYVNEDYFLGRVKSIGSLNKSNLSTGTKTMINIYCNQKDYCFDLCECGNNALKFLQRIKDGYVLFKVPVIAYDFDDEDCDIMFKGVHYTNFYDFLEAAYEL